MAFYNKSLFNSDLMMFLLQFLLKKTSHNRVEVMLMISLIVIYLVKIKTFRMSYGF